MSEKLVNRVVLLDGGMGQELIKRSKSKPHPLWSAKVLHDEPKLVEDAHADFIRSGGKIITLSTYSITPERLARDGNVSLFKELQSKALKVALRARDRMRAFDVRIAGCLPASLLLPLHQFPRQGDDEGHYRCALPRDPKEPGTGSAGSFL